MPLSNYLKIYPCRDRADSFILYSTIKSSVIRVPAEFLEAARNETLSDTDRATLSRLEMFTDDLAAERERMRSIIASSNKSLRTFKAVVVLNLDCNLDCGYCYEGNFRGGNYMTAETGRLVVETVARDQMGRGYDVEIDFYGGEPLLSLPLLKEIAVGLQQKAKEHGVKFSFGMVSNGTLMNRALVEELLPLGFTGAKLTLDGTREIHDKQRPFASGSGSFDCILANIKEIYQLISLQVGGNYGKENYRDYPLMLDALLAEGIDPKQLAPIQFAPIVPKSGKSAGPELANLCTSSNDPWLYESAIYLREETLKRGFAALKPTMSTCMIEFDSNLVVYYDGSLYKCPSFMGWPELSIGTLADGIRDYSQSHALKIWDNQACLDCSYLPMCFGGCRLLPLLRNGVIDEVDCRREFFDATLESLIIQDLQYKA